jgi:Holliday junction resolvase RusA-like endonuclease
MTFISKRIVGVPYSRYNRRGKVAAPKAWTDRIVEQTKDLPEVKEVCIVKITFLLLGDKFPKDYPFGPDVDNLLKRFLDALNATVFKKSKGKDSCIISLTVMKAKVESETEAGALLEILPVSY